MAHSLGRRAFLRTSAVLGGASVLGGVLPRGARAAGTLDVPVVDKLVVRVLVDSSFDNFFRPNEVNGVSVAAGRSVVDYRRSLHNEWGLSLWLESQLAQQQRNFLLDYGYTPGVLANNIELMGVDPGKLDALIISHGHHDHYGVACDVVQTIDDGAAEPMGAGILLWFQRWYFCPQ